MINEILKEFLADKKSEIREINKKYSLLLNKYHASLVDQIGNYTTKHACFNMHLHIKLMKVYIN